MKPTVTTEDIEGGFSMSDEQDEGSGKKNLMASFL
jgi:hypothetical protein